MKVVRAEYFAWVVYNDDGPLLFTNSLENALAFCLDTELWKEGYGWYG